MPNDPAAGDPIKPYRLGVTRRLVNLSVKPLTRLGAAGRHTYLLTVHGRKSGRAYTTPVRLIENGERWLVAPYGEVGWVRNARAAGEVELSRGRRRERLAIAEASPEQAAPVLREYLRHVAVARPFFNVDTDSSDAEFLAEAPRHPVFRLTER